MDRLKALVDYLNLVDEGVRFGCSHLSFDLLGDTSTRSIPEDGVAVLNRSVRRTASGRTVTASGFAVTLLKLRWSVSPRSTSSRRDPHASVPCCDQRAGRGRHPMFLDTLGTPAVIDEVQRGGDPLILAIKLPGSRHTAVL